MCLSWTQDIATGRNLTMHAFEGEHGGRSCLVASCVSWLGTNEHMTNADTLLSGVQALLFVLAREEDMDDLYWAEARDRLSKVLDTLHAHVPSLCPPIFPVCFPYLRLYKVVLLHVCDLPCICRKRLKNAAQTDEAMLLYAPHYCAVACRVDDPPRLARK